MKLFIVYVNDYADLYLEENTWTTLLSSSVKGEIRCCGGEDDLLTAISFASYAQ